MQFSALFYYSNQKIFHFFAFQLEATICCKTGSKQYNKIKSWHLIRRWTSVWCWLNRICCFFFQIPSAKTQSKSKNKNKNKIKTFLIEHTHATKNMAHFFDIKALNKRRRYWFKATRFENWFQQFRWMVVVFLCCSSFLSRYLLSLC